MIYGSIQLDADVYSPEEAGKRYVDHPEGVPDLVQNWLVLGPRGAGKTLMLKALAARHKAAEHRLPVYIDMLPWLSRISGEATRYGGGALTPRDLALQEGVNLVVSLGLIQAATDLIGQELLPLATSVLPGTNGIKDKDQFGDYIRHSVGKALVGARPEGEIPTVFVVAHRLGEAIKSYTGKAPAFLIDQVDQLAAPFFEPITSLLRRGGAYTATIAARPAPTAPEAERFDSSVVAGDSYQLLYLGRQDREWRDSFIRPILLGLNLDADVLDELTSYIPNLASTSWPSVRTAIWIAVLYERYREVGLTSSAAFEEALRRASRGYQDTVGDSLRAWSEPSRVVATLRSRSEEVRARRPTFGRTGFRLTHLNLFDDVPSAEARVLRTCLNQGILFPGPGERPPPGALPAVYEINPLLVLPSVFKAEDRFEPKLLLFDLRVSDLKKWVSGRRTPSAGPGKIFLSFWMSDPEDHVRPFLTALRERLLGSAEIVTGHVSGSAQWSPNILKTLAACKLTICHLDAPRRDIFVEYGWSVGLRIPVLQVLPEEEPLHQFADWVTERQFQFWREEQALTRLAAEVIHILNKSPDKIEQWIWEPPSTDIDFSADPNSVCVIGSPEDIASARDLCDPIVHEARVDVRYVQLDSSRAGKLYEVISAVRKSGCLILLFNGSLNDQLLSVAGGILTARPFTPSKRGGRLQRSLILVNLLLAAGLGEAGMAGFGAAL